MYTTTETVNVEQNGEEVGVLNDRCIHDTKTEAVDLDKQDEADDSTDTPPTDNTDGNPTTIKDTS